MALERYCEKCADVFNLPQKGAPTKYGPCGLCGTIQKCHEIVRVDDPHDNFMPNFTLSDYLNDEELW